MFRTSVFISFVLVLVAAPAMAGSCVDVEVGFDPASVSAGDRVTLTAYLANLGGPSGPVDIQVTLGFNDHTFGPIGGSIHLESGKEIEGSIELPVPPAIPAGTLTLTVEASLDDCTDISTATLEILGDGEGDAAGSLLAATATGFLHALGMAPTPTQPSTWGALKQRYP